MKTLKRWPRTLLITGLVLSALWAATTPTSEAAQTVEDNGRITWELTPDAITRTLSGNDCPLAGLDVCREECIFAEPTGNFLCFPN